MDKSLFLTIIVLVFFSISDGAVYEGRLKTQSQWHFFHKFCFSNQFNSTGYFEFVVNTANNYNGSLQMMLYLGVGETDSGSWDAAYNARNEKSCAELVAMHRDGSAGITPVKNGQIYRFSPFQVTRAYFWYAAVADCDSLSGIDIIYQAQFINPGGIWDAQFSYDEQGVLQMYITFAIFYIILMLVHFWGVWQMTKDDSWHPIVRILTAALFSEFLSCIMELIHYSIYVNDGIGALGMHSVGELLDMTSQILLMFLCILVAKGWAITSSLLTHKQALIIILGFFLISYLSLFIWDNAGRDPASTIYFYDSVPGLIVILMRVAMTAWFLWCLRSTLSFEMLPDKRRFYILYGFFYTIWFLILPGIVALALVFAEWERFKTVKALTLTADSLAFLSLVILWWPSRASSLFKFKPIESLISIDDLRKNYGSDSSL